MNSFLRNHGKWCCTNATCMIDKSDSDDKAEFEKNSIIKSLGIILKKNFIMQITTEPIIQLCSM